MFSLPRASLISKITQLVPYFPTLSMKNKLELLLNGINTKNNIDDCRNVPIMFAMQSYILLTKRFEKQP